MSRITFKRVTPEESVICDADGDRVGEVFRQPDILHPGRHYYLIWLDEDPRGYVRVFDRSRIPRVTQERLDSHPYY